MSTSRIAWIDIAKGLGILLIVLGHNDLAAYHPTLHKFVYSFHIPLFFFLSGLFFRPQRTFTETVWRRFHTLLRPYLFVLCLIALGNASFSNMTFSVIVGRFLKGLYATGYYIDWVQLWFLPHLFAVALFAWVIWRSGLGRLPWLGARLAILFVLLAIGVFTMPFFWPFRFPIGNVERYGLPFSLDLMLASGFFFLLGYEFNQRFPQHWLASPMSLLVTFGALLAMVLTLPPTLDFNTRTYPSLWVNTAEALLGIGMTLSLARLLEASPWLESLTRMLRYFGRISLVILVFHVPIQEAFFQKLVRLGLSTDPALALAFLSGVLIPALIYEGAIHRNPRLRPWFGFPGEETSSA